jgi:hypothetical protein
MHVVLLLSTRIDLDLLVDPTTHIDRVNHEFEQVKMMMKRRRRRRKHRHIHHLYAKN